MSSYNGESDSLESTSKDQADKLLKISKNLIFFSLFKSNIIINYTSEELQLKKDIDMMNYKSIGLFPSVILRLLNDKSLSSEESKSINIRTFGSHSQKFYDLSGIDIRSVENFKDITKTKILKVEDLIYYLNNTRNNILFKKQYHFTFICFEIEIKFGPKQKSKVTYLEFQNPFERNVEKSEKAEKEKPTKNLESSIEVFINPLKTLYTIFTNSKNDQSINDKDKIMDILKENWNQTPELQFHANLRPIYPFFSQDLLLLQYLNKIFEKKESFDTPFISMLLQIILNLINKKNQANSKYIEKLPIQESIEEKSNLAELLKKYSIKEEENSKLVKENQGFSKLVTELRNQKNKLENEFEFLKKNTSTFIEKMKNQYEKEIEDLKNKINSHKCSYNVEKKAFDKFNFEQCLSVSYFPVDISSVMENTINLNQNHQKITSGHDITSLRKLSKLVSNGFLSYLESDINRNFDKLEAVTNLSSQQTELIYKRSKLLENQNSFLKNVISLLIDRQTEISELEKNEKIKCSK